MSAFKTDPKVPVDNIGSITPVKWGKTIIKFLQNVVSVMVKLSWLEHLLGDCKSDVYTRDYVVVSLEEKTLNADFLTGILRW